MATEPILELDQIDLNGIAIDHEAVGKLIPQAGHMRHLDHVIWMNDDLSISVGMKVVRDDEFWVEGHIPGRPILPGVLMIEAAAQNSTVLYRTKTDIFDFLGFTRCDDAIFRGQVVPGDILYLVSKELHFRTKRFITANQAFVNNKLVFEAKITGMRM